MGQLLDTDESMGLSSSEFRMGIKKLVSHKGRLGGLKDR
jgi:hypothetical protein